MATRRRALKPISEGPAADEREYPHLVTGPKRSLSVPDRVALGSVISALAMGFVGGYLVFPAVGFLIAAAILLTVGILVGLS